MAIEVVDRVKQLLPQLDPDIFWQVHRATIVNLRAIARVDRERLLPYTEQCVLAVDLAAGDDEAHGRRPYCHPTPGPPRPSNATNSSRG